MSTGYYDLEGNMKDSGFFDAQRIIDPSSGVEYKRYRIQLSRDCKDMYCTCDFQACQYALAYAGCPQPVTLDRFTVDGENMLYRIFSIEDGDDE